ncbi:hypothetical protein MLD38_011643 [Melastoma candidum]|uniref:Uncharacterized protein n=1 Tax=Melastoma candidum TaxID=119954 RepID=A0ACB9R3R2_9MYRT|nr:hypothetical protein MLD38_011643 [Melastoma candidum]
MEIDLNHAVTELDTGGYFSDYFPQSNGYGGPRVLTPEKSNSASSTSSSSLLPLAPASSVYAELWHACAGTVSSLPKRGGCVLYFPQGHLEQIAASCPSSAYSSQDLPRFDLRPHILCRVTEVELLANKENDEVYTKVSLLPELEVLAKEIEALDGNEDNHGGSNSRTLTSHMFCKTLTASDTSTHGGFSVPRRAAEDCFPPLDYKQERPSQELVAKDLHGVEWKFRHIYRGQPRRHLLTTGWSVFVGQKNLVSGDAVLFLRGADGELRLGVRRALRPKNVLPISTVGDKNFCPAILSTVARAISDKSAFHVFYCPRETHANFVIPVQKYFKSINTPVFVGTRFKMKINKDDAPERRFSGVVTRISDIDPYRWPSSKWRCLMVQWDENFMNRSQDRVSPWDIDPSVPLSPLSIQSSPRLKRLRTSLQETPPVPFPDTGVGLLDFEESLRSSKVLQGQEKPCLASPTEYVRSVINKKLDLGMRNPPLQILASSGGHKPDITNFCSRVNLPPAYAGYLESSRYPRVLQGQEICQLKSLLGTTRLARCAVNLYQGHKLNNVSSAQVFHNQGMYVPQGDILRFGQGVFPGAYMADTNGKLPSGGLSSMPNSLLGEFMKRNAEKDQKEAEKSSFTLVDNFLADKKGNSDSILGQHKLFGFPLTPGASLVPALSDSGKKGYIKVHKQGNLVGRSIDIWKLNNYEDLLCELERLFDMEGLLRDPDKGWRVLFTDSDNGAMVVGDSPWNDFCDMARKIHIFTQEEVAEMATGLISDDTQSCLDQLPAMCEASKSSSVGQCQSDGSPSV